MDYRIETIENPRGRFYLGGNVDVEAYINTGYMADYLSDHNVVYLNGKNTIFYQGSWHEISDDELRLIILKAFPLRPDGHPYYINEGTVKKTISMWKQGWISHPERFNLHPEPKQD